MLILVRHAMPAIDVAVPSRGWRLSEEGRAAATALGATLVRFEPVAVYTSDEPKAIETADALGIGEPIVVPGLHEHERASVPFMDRPTFETSIRRLFDEPDELVFGDETATAALTRYTAAIDGVLASHDGAVIVVSHGTVLSLYIQSRTGADAYTTWKALQMPDAIILE